MCVPVLEVVRIASGDKMVHKYTEEFDLLRLRNIIPDDEQCIAHYIFGSRSHILERIAIHPILSIDDAYRDAWMTEELSRRLFRSVTSRVFMSISSAGKGVSSGQAQPSWIPNRTTRTPTREEP